MHKEELIVVNKKKNNDVVIILIIKSIGHSLMIFHMLLIQENIL